MRELSFEGYMGYVKILRRTKIPEIGNGNGNGSIV